MRKDTFLKKLRETDDMQRFWSSEYEGSCPCFWGEKIVDGETVGFHGRCWRVSDHSQDLYAWGTDKKFTKEVAQIVKKALDEQKWYNPYTIIYKKFI